MEPAWYIRVDYTPTLVDGKLGAENGYLGDIYRIREAEVMVSERATKGIDWLQDNIDVQNFIPKRRLLNIKHHHMEYVTSFASNGEAHSSGI